ncbi:hypothetical protein AB0B44_34550, partial [Streptomyces sp. NPDC041003]
MINYEGRRFRKPKGDVRTVAVYHQQGDLVWGEVIGGEVRRGWTVGTCDRAPPRQRQRLDPLPARHRVRDPRRRDRHR